MGLGIIIPINLFDLKFNIGEPIPIFEAHETFISIIKFF